MAGVPSAVHGAFMRESPVDARPAGAGPGAAGTRMIGVALYSSATVDLHSLMYRVGNRNKRLEGPDELLR